MFLSTCKGDILIGSLRSFPGANVQMCTCFLEVVKKNYGHNIGQRWGGGGGEGGYGTFLETKAGSATGLAFNQTINIAVEGEGVRGWGQGFF